jgi:tetratricopeptide (TPR) repeat protein
MNPQKGCSGGPAEAYAERYLAGDLPEMDSERFEEHFLACANCHDWLLGLQDVKEELRRRPMPVVVAAPKPVRQGFFTRPVRIVALGSLAAALAVGVIFTGISIRRNSFTVISEAPQPDRPAVGQTASGDRPAAPAAAQTEDLSSLADLRMPAYREPMLRGAESASAAHREFLDGMDSYQKGDCDAAVSHLAMVPASASDGLQAELFLGLCHLQRKDWIEAQASLEKVVHSGDTPQLETAEYFLAQAMLEQGDLASARTHLAKTIALHGDYEEKASAQLRRLSLETTPRTNP